MSNSTLIGKRRSRNRTGDVAGPYEVDRPVGDDWRTTVYWVLRCPLCGYELQVANDSIHTLKKRKSCGRCGAKKGQTLEQVL